MREGWKVQIFDTVEEVDVADRLENLARTVRERIRLLSAISAPNAERPQPRIPGSQQILDGPQR